MLPATVVEGELPAGPGPTAPPSGAQTVEIGDETDFVQRVTWINGDLNAHTQVGFVTGCVFGTPDNIRTIVNPQISQWEGNEGESCTWYVRHIRNGQTSAWVLAPCVGECTE